MMSKMLLAIALLALLPLSVVRAADPVVTATVTDFALGENNHVDISVLIDNPTSSVLDLRYRVELVATDEKTAGRIADTSPYESVDVAPRSNVTQKISYTAPPFVDGEYDLHITVQSGAGFPVASSMVGRTAFVGRPLPISLESCQLVAPNQGQGIATLSIGSIPVVICELKNTTDEHQWVRLAGEWTRWGQPVSDDSDESSVETDVIFAPKEKQKAALTLPVIERAGQYEGTLYLETGAERVSRSVSVMAQVAGDGGAIQSVELDRDSYAQGDTAAVTAYILTTRVLAGATASLAGALVTATLSDGSGRACAAPMSHALETGVEKWAISVERNCSDPQVTVALAAQDGQTLDQSMLSLKSADSSQGVFSSKGPLAVLVIAFVFLAGLAVYLVSRAKGQSGGALRSLVYGALFVGSMLLSPAVASASTLSGGVGLPTDNWWWEGTGSSINYYTHNSRIYLGRTTIAGPMTVMGNVAMPTDNFSIIGNSNRINLYTGNSSNYAGSLIVTGGTMSGSASCNTDAWSVNGSGSQLVIVCGNGSGGSLTFTDTPPPPIYACSGATPANASIYSGDDTGLSANTPKTYSATDTAPKCQYVCNGGFNWNGSACQPIAGPVNGVCGAASSTAGAPVTMPIAPSGPPLCSSGTASVVGPAILWWPYAPTPMWTNGWSWSCNGSGGGTSQGCQGTYQSVAPPSTTFTGTYGAITSTVLALPAGGGNVTLDWSTINAAGGNCTTSAFTTTGSIPNWKPGVVNKPVTGNEVVSVTATTRFDLTCRNISGTAGPLRSVTVTVPAAAITYTVCPLAGLALNHTSTLSGQLSLYSRSDGTVPSCALPLPVDTSDLTMLPTTTWATPGGIVTIGNGATGGRVNVVSGVSGPTTVSATIGGVVVGSALVNVAAAPAPTYAICPSGSPALNTTSNPTVQLDLYRRIGGVAVTCSDALPSEKITTAGTTDWSSSAPGIASVNNAGTKGNVTGIATGPATITARDGGSIAGLITVTVVGCVSSTCATLPTSITDQYCPTDSFTTVNGCGGSLTCGSGTGTRSCNFNWREVQQ